MNCDGIEIRCGTIVPDLIDQVAIDLQQSNELETLQVVIPFVPKMMGNGVGIGADTGVRSKLGLSKIKVVNITYGLMCCFLTAIQLVTFKMCRLSKISQLHSNS